MDTKGLISDTIDDEFVVLRGVKATRLEKMILVVFTLFILMVLIVSGWSAILLVTGDGGGGPLGLIANILQIERVLS